eukprot:SAG11_NODE_32577_length_282_cov_1.131148_1_plen_60_part_01
MKIAGMLESQTIADVRASPEAKASATADRGDAIGNQGKGRRSAADGKKRRDQGSKREIRS